MDQLDKEILELAVENRSLEESLGSVQTIRDTLKNAQVSLDEPVAKLDSALKELADYAASPTPQDAQPSGKPDEKVEKDKDFGKKADTVSDAIYSCQAAISEPLGAFSELQVLEPKTENLRIKSALRDLGFRSRSVSFRSNEIPGKELKELADKLSWESSSESATAKEIVAIAKNVPRGTENLKNWKDQFTKQKNELIAKITVLEKAFTERKAAITADLEAHNTMLRDTDATLTDMKKAAAVGAAAEAESNGKTNSMLTWALYMMVAVLGITLIMLLWFSLRQKDGTSTLGKMIIESRLLIEVLSMGFLLLTIVILGTSKTLESQGLAAILGTTAGYTFGRNQGDKPDKGTTPGV